MARLLLAMACMALALGRAPAVAQESTCPEGFRDWVAACAASSGVAMAAGPCADGVAVVDASSVGAAIQIELTAQPERPSFVRVGAVGLSPIGSFEDWSAVDPDIRREFDAVRACVATGPPDLIEATGATTSPDGSAHDDITWRIALALAALIAWCAMMLASARTTSRRLDGIGVALAASIVRRIVIAPAFFHQNGHGPGWVDHALCMSSSYGPGYASVLHLPARAAGVGAERGAFLAQEVLAALAVAAVYAIARGLAASRLVALAIALAFAIDPLVMRLARSESYFAVALALITLALASLLAPGLRARARDPRLWAHVGLAAVLLSMAATVHPVAWVPVACAPSVLLLRAATRRERWSTMLGGLVLVGLVGCVLALSPALAVLHGSLGRQWGDQTPQASHLATLVFVLALPWTALLLPRRIATWVAPCLVIVMTLVADQRTNLFGQGSTIAPAEAWRLLFRVTALVAAIALVARVQSVARRRSRRVPALAALAIVVFGVGRAAATFQSATTLPTDALELQHFAPLLQALPEGSRLHYLSRVGRMCQELPLYPSCGPMRVLVANDRADQPPRPIGPGEYWFRSATCSTTEGRPVCDAIERRLVLRAVDEVTLPARTSLPYLPYDEGEIVSGLYHVEALRDR